MLRGAGYIVLLIAALGCNGLSTSEEGAPLDAAPEAVVPSGGTSSSSGGAAGAPIAGAGGITSDAGSDSAPETSVSDSGCNPSFLAMDSGQSASIVASGQQEPSAVVFNPELKHVYFVEAATASSPGSVKRAALDGTNLDVVTLASGLSNPRSVRTNGIDVFFSNDWDESGGGSPGVYKVSPNGGTPPVLVGGDAFGAGYMDFAFGNLYSEAYKTDEPGAIAARVRVTAAKSASPLATCYPYRSPAVGGRIAGIWSDGTEVYAIDTAADAIMRSPTTPCSGATGSVFAAKMGHARAIAGHGSSIYWVTADAVHRLDRNNPGGTPTALLCGQSDLTNIDVNDKDLMAVTNAGDGSVLLGNGDGAFSAIATGQNQPIGLRVLPVGLVLWTNRAGGEVMRFPG